MPKMKNTLWIVIGGIVVITVAVVVLMGGYQLPGYQAPTVTAPTEQVTPIGEVKEFTVSGTEYSFSPSSITVNKGDTVRIAFNNVGSFDHNFGISAFGVRSRTISAGASDTIEFVADRSGTFDFDCSVRGHSDRGMLGSLAVI